MICPLNLFSLFFSSYFYLYSVLLPSFPFFLSFFLLLLFGLTLIMRTVDLLLSVISFSAAAAALQFGQMCDPTPIYR